MLVEMARCLLQAKYMPPHFWDEVVYCENYLLNHILTRVVPSMTLVERWCGKKPSIGHLHVFGCVSWDHFDDCRKKLDAKSHACIMMGYSEESKSYRLFDPVK
jgi:hypothetical protein